MADKLGPNGGSPRPGADYFLFVLLVHVGNFGRQVAVGERSFFQRSAHVLIPIRRFLFLYFSAHDPFVSALVVARLKSAGRLSPGGHRMTATRSLAFATAMRMVHRIHRNTAVVRAAAQPTGLTRLAVRFVLMLDVAHLADGGHALHLNPSNLAGRQFQKS